MLDHFNPFRSSTYARLWRVTRKVTPPVMRLLAASLEVYLHHNFGRRYLKTLGFSLLACLVFTTFVPGASLIHLFLLGFIVLLVRHYIFNLNRQRRGMAEPHSLSAGEPFGFWQRLGLPPTTVQRYLEPLLCGGIGLLFRPVDPFLSGWLLAASVSLFVKEQMARLQTNRRVFDALDARIQAQQMTAAITQHLNHRTQRGTQFHHPRLPGNNPKRRP